MKQQPCIKQYVLVENYNNKDQQFDRHGFRWQFQSWSKIYLKIRVTTFKSLPVGYYRNCVRSSIFGLKQLIYM